MHGKLTGNRTRQFLQKMLLRKFILFSERFHTKERKAAMIRNQYNQALHVPSKRDKEKNALNGLKNLLDTCSDSLAPKYPLRSIILLLIIN